MNKLWDTLKNEVDELKRVRDELKVQAHLGKAEAKETWNRLEAHWPTVENKIKEIEASAVDLADELVESTKSLVDEIRQGYQKMRK